ncbi:B12-binding domain-containing radical SAM protein [Magnetococcales bacterium HHB-1]
MKVCLINPPWYTKSGNIWSQIRSTMPPLGLLYIAAIIEQDHEVEVIDFQALMIDWEETKKRIESTAFDIYGITASTPTINYAFKLADVIKTCHPKSKVVLGGVHPTSLPEESLSHQSIDYVIRGEGEENFPKLLAGEALENIQGLSYRHTDGSIKHNYPDGIYHNLDNLPYPAYHKVDLTQYKPAIGAFKRLPGINMTATRGCPAKCTFCNSAEIKLRKRSAEHIFREMRMLSEKYGIREISFYDDTFTVFPSNIIRLCNLLIEHQVDLTWSCFARVDYVNHELLSHMKRAGCHQVMYGIESSSPEILRNIKKTTSKSYHRKAIDALKMTHEVGITSRCTFMFGNPGETEESIDETIEYAKQLDPDIALFNITTPYPGTEMFSWAKEKGYLLTENWDEYDLHDPVMKLPTISPEVIQKKYREAFIKFYFRPSKVFKWLRKQKSLADFSIFLQGSRALLSFIKR